jgi:uncharacterized membrane protein HdeD (DUF308 family)
MTGNSLLWRGLLAIVVGVIAVAWPGITIGAFVILFAIYALIAAGMDTARAFHSGRVGPVFGYLLLALVSVAAALAALAWPAVTVFVLVIWVAAWAAISGFTELFLAFRHDERAGERALLLLNGVVLIALGFVLFVRPLIGAVTLAEVFGLFSIFYGAGWLVRGFSRHGPVDSGSPPE